MVAVRIVKPSMEWREEYLAFYKEWISSGEDIVPWVVERDPSDFEAYLGFLYAEDSEGKLSAPSKVPHSTYWLLNEENHGSVEDYSEKRRNIRIGVY